MVGNVLLVGLRGRVFLAYDLVELRLRVFAACAESVVPDVEAASSFRPSRCAIELCDARNARREVSTSSSIFFTRASGICRFSSNRRAISVGAEGDHASTCRCARKTARSLA